MIRFDNKPDKNSKTNLLILLPSRLRGKINKVNRKSYPLSLKRVFVFPFPDLISADLSNNFPDDSQALFL